MSYDVLLAGQLVWNTPLLVSLICVAGVYACLVRYWTNRKMDHRQSLLFFLGLGLFYLTMGSPLTTLSHLSFSSHMIQMSVLYFIIPPILLFGIPHPLFQCIWKKPTLRRVRQWCLPSKVALYVFALLFLIYHFPLVLNLLAQSSLMHKGYVWVLFLLSLRMWWPIVAPKQNLCQAEKKRYAFLSGLMLMPACLLFIVTSFSGGTSNPFLSQITTHLCLPPQAHAVDFIATPFNTQVDQLMGGMFMLGMHKFGLVLTLRLEDKVYTQPRR